ncbi:hypothetical protein ACFYO2_27910 [Streptomyces sp. NPDC006602]|uniref:hypothetical protein n=1 Tax=Streptomyces sp. NPDC006602 TaxID=3364751 RepID=UPI0036754B8B
MGHRHAVPDAVRDGEPRGRGRRPALARLHQGRGYSGTDITLPAINFDGDWQDNLVGTGALNFRRVEQVVTDTGSTIDVTYGHATDVDGTLSRQCDESSPPSQANNDFECFWQKWTPEGETEPRTGWFKKFVVTRCRSTRAPTTTATRR